MSQFLHHLARFVVLMPVVLSAAFAAEEPRAVQEKAITIQADQARAHLGERVTVTFKVQHAKFATEPDRVYLDSEKDYRDPKNLGVLIEAASLPAFKKAGIDKPADHYDGKTIRITGKLFEREKNVFIKAEKPDEIAVIETEKRSSL
jgi:hypothetical protein